MPDDYFDELYAQAADPWHLATRWYEQRKYAITLALLPRQHYRHVFEPGCSIGVSTALLTERCASVTATDVVAAALDNAQRRLDEIGRGAEVTFVRSSWTNRGRRAPSICWCSPKSATTWHLTRCTAFSTGNARAWRMARRWSPAHWRHHVDDYLMAGDRVNEIVADTAGLHSIASYRDDDVAIDVFDTADRASVAARSGVPGS